MLERFRLPLSLAKVVGDALTPGTAPRGLWEAEAACDHARAGTHVEVPCRAGRQLAVDVTLRSVLNALGEPIPCATSVDGVMVECGRRSKAAARE